MAGALGVKPNVLRATNGAEIDAAFALRNRIVELSRLATPLLQCTIFVSLSKLAV